MENRELDLRVESGDGGLLAAEPYSARAYFSTPGRKGLLDQLVHLLQFGEGLPVLIGPPGAGKTVLLAELSRELMGTGASVYCALSEEADLAENLAIISEAVGLELKPRAIAGEMLAALRHYGQALAHEQKKVTLLLDDAHLLDDSSLGAMVSLLQGREATSYGLSLLMAARSGLVERLDSISLLEVPVYDFDIPLLSAAELESFLNFVGHGGVVSESPDSVRGLWAKSLGNPGVVLSLVKVEATSSTGLEGLPSPAASVVRRFFSGLPVGHLAAMVLLAGVLLWALISRDEGATGGTEVISVELPSLAPAPPRSAGPETVVGRTALPALGADDPARAATGESEKVSVTDRVITDVSTAMPMGDAGLNSIPITAPRSAPPVIAPLPAVPVPIDTPERIAEPTIKNTPAPIAAPIQVTPSAVSTDEIFLMARGDDEYTLQVLAASKAGSLKAYIGRQTNREDLYLYRGLREGRRRFVVVAGVYPSRQAALLARDALPEEQREAGPWPRQLRDIKQEIDENQRN
ncbi:AAA family ATPase [Teredinibacter franksiae]|uniref:AAA family ATPase n=1 Tax=Teredinibacter franksiae TaxID=2761453 RepID=UPI001625E8CF|nr:AAA family ATPase [Teredinibacter franksiae]